MYLLKDRKLFKKKKGDEGKEEEKIEESSIKRPHHEISTPMKSSE